MWDAQVGALRVTLGEAMAAMRGAVEDRGASFTYPDEWRADAAEDETGGCRYVVDGGPACLIAAALGRLGVPVAVLSEQGDRDIDDLDCEDGCEGTAGARTLLDALLPEDMDEVAVRLISDAYDKAQTEQDRGMTWGHAYEAACDSLLAGAR